MQAKQLACMRECTPLARHYTEVFDSVHSLDTS